MLFRLSSGSACYVPKLSANHPRKGRAVAEAGGTAYGWNFESPTPVPAKSLSAEGGRRPPPSAAPNELRAGQIILLRWSTLLNGTRSELSNWRLPHPINATSSGILSPASRIAVIAPIATGSLQQKIPVGHGLTAMSLIAAWYPARDADVSSRSALTMYSGFTGMPCRARVCV